MTAVRTRPRSTGTGPDPDRRRRRRIRIVALLATALVLVTLDFRGNAGIFGTVRDGVAEVLAPVRAFGGWATSPLRNGWKGITDYDDVIDENARLRDELAQAQQDVLLAGELQRELDALRAETGVNPAPGLRRITTRVIEAPVSSFERTIELDRGSDDGIELGMPVTTGGGLLGRISHVSPSRSRVELITDPDVAVGIRLVRSGDRGTTRGEGPGRPILVDLIALDTPVTPGESVVTSGLQGSPYPEGLLVGTVTAARPEPIADRQAVEVAPVASADSLRFATVILFQPEPLPTTTTTTTTTTVPDDPATTAVPTGGLDGSEVDSEDGVDGSGDGPGATTDTADPATITTVTGGSDTP